MKDFRVGSSNRDYPSGTLSKKVESRKRKKQLRGTRTILIHKVKVVTRAATGVATKVATGVVTRAKVRATRTAVVIGVIRVATLAETGETRAVIGATKTLVLTGVRRVGGMVLVNFSAFDLNLFDFI